MHASLTRRKAFTAACVVPSNNPNPDPTPTPNGVKTVTSGAAQQCSQAAHSHPPAHPGQSPHTTTHQSSSRISAYNEMHLGGRLQHAQHIEDSCGERSNRIRIALLWLECPRRPGILGECCPITSHLQHTHPDTQWDASPIQLSVRPDSGPTTLDRHSHGPVSPRSGSRAPCTYSMTSRRAG